MFAASVIGSDRIGSWRKALPTTTGNEIIARSTDPPSYGRVTLPFLLPRKTRFVCSSPSVRQSGKARVIGISRGCARILASAVGSPSPDTAVKSDEMAEAEAETVPVVSPDWLHQHLNDPDLKVLDASWYMPAEKRNPLQEYQGSHIPGALFFDLDGVVDARSELPHMLPSEAVFSAAASALGIENHHPIVVYDGAGIFSAPRAWWMFRAFGHQKVWVLDGGLPLWRGQAYPVESTASAEALERIKAASEAVKLASAGKQVASNIFKAHLQQHLVWSLDQVLENIQGKKHILVDARSKGRFDGTAPEPRAGMKGGHVPGSTCVPFPKVLSSTGTLLPAEELAQQFQQAGAALDSPIVTSCGTGVTACVLALALYRLGKTDVPVYDGSWTEWGQAHNTPVEKNL